MDVLNALLTCAANDILLTVTHICQFPLMLVLQLRHLLLLLRCTDPDAQAFGLRVVVCNVHFFLLGDQVCLLSDLLGVLGGHILLRRLFLLL